MNLGFTEMFFLFVLGLLLFGPKKLPEIGRQLGKVFAEFKRASNEFQSQLHDEVRKLDDEANAAKEQVISGILPPGVTARGDLSEYIREPNSGEHEGPVPNEIQSEDSKILTSSESVIEGQNG